MLSELLAFEIGRKLRSRPVLIDIAGERFTFAGDPKQLPSQEIGTR